MTGIAKVSPAYKGSFVLNADPMVSYIDDVLSTDECEHIICLAKDKVKRARVSRKGDAGITDGRTGSNTWLSHNTDGIVQDIAERIAGIVGISLKNAEALQVIHYGVDQQYKAHYDAYDLTTERGQHYCKRGGQRLVTALAYLNEIMEGGATRFPKLDSEIPARAGRVALFHNCYSGTTEMHPDSLHAGTPIIQGEKWAFNIWFHVHPMSERQDFTNSVVKTAEKARAISVNKKNDTDQRYQINRASALFKTALDNIDSDIRCAGVNPYFTYWDEFGNNPVDLSCAPKDSKVYKLIGRTVLNQLSDKRSLAKLLQEKRIEAIAPITYLNKEDALKHRNPPVNQWFLKSASGTHGKGMECVANTDLNAHEVPENFVIQAAIQGIMLLEGKKFTPRIYCLIWNKRLYLYKNGFIITHGAKYNQSSTDYSVQIDHHGYQAADSPINMSQLIHYKYYDRYYSLFREMLISLAPVLDNCRNNSDEGQYVLLGIDVLLQRKSRVQLVEINTIPNFLLTKEINEQVNIPFFEASMRIMFGLGSEDMDRII